MTYESNSGPALPWEGEFGDIATLTGNKVTEIPLVSWTARGGMEVEFSLYHNNRGNHTAELGHKWTHSFDIYAYVDPFTGDVLIHWGHDGVCQYTNNFDGTYSAPPGIHDVLTASGNPINQYTLTTTDQIRYHFTNPNGTGWHCTSISDLKGNAITIGRNANNYVTSVTDPTNRTLTLGYDGSNRITSVTDPLSRQWTLQYNGSNELSQVNWPLVGGNAYNVQLTYNADHNITGYRDLRGNVWAYGYSSGDISSLADPLGNTINLTYPTNKTRITDANSNVTEHAYDLWSGTLTSVKDPLNNVESFVWDGNRHCVQVTDRRGKIWQYTFDSSGNVLTRTSPLNHTWTWTYNSLNQVLTETSPLNHQWQFTYDGVGNLLTEKTPLNHTTTHQYGSYGLRANTSTPLGHTSYFTYSTNGDLTQVTDPNNITCSVTFNALGWKLTETDGLSNQTVYTLDNWGRVTQVAVAGITVSQTGYDANSNVVWTKDGLNNQTTTVFDSADRVTSVTNGKGDVVTYTWDAVGKKGLLSTKRNGNLQTTTYSYTARMEKASHSYPDGTSESWTYNANGDVGSHTDQKSQTIQYSWDDSGRLTLIDYPLGTDTSFVYDSADRRTSMTDSTGTTSWTFDSADRLTQITSPNGTVGYGYDNSSRRTSVTVTGQGTWSTVYDAGGRVTSTTNPYSETTSWLYNAANLPTQQTFSSGAVTTFQYDGLNRQTDVWHKTSGGATLGRYQYAYNAVNVTSRTDNDGSVTSFGYDGANQLTSESRTNPGAYTLSYSYDNNGNRTSKTLNGVPENYTYGNNDRILTAGGRSYVTDNNGNITSVTVGGQTTTLTWNYENKLTRIDYPGGAFNTFKYNGLGLRTQKVDSGGTQNYVTDGSSVASPVLVDSAATYTPGIGERRGGTTKFYHADNLGSTRGITNTSQAATDSILYDAFGTVVSRTGTTPTPFGFVGAAQYQTDSDSGLHLLGHRYYDPNAGRFVSQDPIADGDNWYAYADNNPLMGIDPEGLRQAPGKSGGLPTEHITIDEKQVGDIQERIKQILADGNKPSDRKELNILKRKLKKHKKGTGEIGSRQSKDTKKPPKKRNVGRNPKINLLPAKARAAGRIIGKVVGRFVNPIARIEFIIELIGTAVEAANEAYSPGDGA